MSAASTPPQRTINIRPIPPEIVEKILLNLAVKSLVRFRSVSKLWNSMILESRFVQEHKSRGRGKIVTMPSHMNELTAGASICRICNVSLTIEDSTAVIHPNEALAPHRRPSLLAYCDELWLVGTDDESLYLWNHSMRSSRDLRRKARMYEFVYGLAYDSAADDYKVLRIRRRWCSRKTELYSLKSDSWEDIFENSTRKGKVEYQKKCEFVKGAFHWIVTTRPSHKRRHTLVSFDLSTRKHREVALLPAIEDGGGGGGWVEAVDLKGNLCVCGCELINYLPRWFFWVMATEIRKHDCPAANGIYVYNESKPSYFYDNGDFLFTQVQERKNVGLFLYKKKEARVSNQIIIEGVKINGGFAYVETLVSLK